MMRLLRLVIESALWLCACAVLCFVIETAYVGYFGFIRGVCIAAIAVFVLIAIISDRHAYPFWWLASLATVGFACAALHPLLRLEGAFGTFLPPARQWLTQHDRELFVTNLGTGALGGLLAVVVMLAITVLIVGFGVLRARNSMAGHSIELKVDLATFGPRHHERLCQLCVSDDRSLASEAISRLDPVRDRDTLKAAMRKWPDNPCLGIGFLLTLPYPEEAEFLNEQLAHYPQYAHYDLTCGWPHKHQFEEISCTNVDDDQYSSQTVTDEACSCGYHRITRTTRTIAEHCPKCGQELRLEWNDNIYKSWDEPPKPWYGYDAYCDPEMYTSGFVCSRCGYFPEQDDSSFFIEKETISYVGNRG